MKDKYRKIVEGKHYLLTLSDKTKKLEWVEVNLKNVRRK